MAVPVDIEFVIGGDYKGKLDDVKASIAGVGDANAAATKKLKEQLAESRSAVKHMEADIVAMRKTFSKIAPGAPTLSLHKEIASATKAISEEKRIIAELEAQLRSAAPATVSFRTEQLRVTEQLRRMREAGQANTAEYERLKQKLGELATIMRTTTAESRQLSTGGSFAAGLASGISGITGAMSAAAGVMGVFNAKNEELARIQARVQSLMAITIGMQQVATTLHQTSAFRINIVTKAKLAWAAAVKVLNVQLGISIALSKALMASGIGAIIAGVAMLAVAIAGLVKAQKKANEELKKFNDAAAESAKQPIASVEQLSRKFAALNGDIKRQEQFVLEHKGAFEKLGASITSVADAQKLLIDNKEAFINAQISKTKALAAADLASDLVEKKVKNDLNLEQVKRESPTVEDKVVYHRDTGSAWAAPIKKVLSYKENPEIKKLEDESKALEAQIKGFFDAAAKYESEGYEALTKLGVQGAKAFEDGAVGAIRQAISRRQEAIESMSDRKAIVAEQREIEALQKQLDALLGKEGKAKDDKAQEDSEYKAQSDLHKLLRDIQAQTDKLQLELQEDGLQKRLAELDREKEQELAKIEEKNKVIVDAYNKKHPNAKAEGIADIDAGAAAEQETALLEMQDKYREKSEKTIEEFIKSYGEYAEKRLAVEEQYQRDIAELEGKNADGRYDGAIENMRIQRSRELHTLELEAGKATKTITKLFADMSGKSVKYMEAVADEAEAMVKFLDENETFRENEFGISEDDFLRLKKTPAELSKVTQASKKLRDDVNDTKTGFEKFIITLKKMGAAMEGGNDAELAKSFQEAMGYAQGIASALDMAAGAMSAVAEATGNKKLKEFADTLDTVSKTIQGAGSGAAIGAQVGGGYGAIIGAVAGGIMSLVTSMSEQAAEADKIYLERMERIKTLQRERVLAELELKRLTDERLQVEDAVNKSRLEVVEAEKKILEQKKEGAESRLNELTKKITESTYTAIETRMQRNSGRGSLTTSTKHEVEKSILDYVNPATRDTTSSSTSYRGITTTRNNKEYVWDEASIDRLRALRAQEEALKDADKEYIDAILAAWEEVEQYADDALEKEKERKQLLTGATQDGLLDGLKSGLAAGKKEFADFAGDAEDILREALLSAVTAGVGGEALNRLYEDLYASVSDGSLTAEEMERFKEGYARIGENMGKALEALNQAGIDITGGDTSLTGAVKTITEQSASLLAGQMNGIRVNVREQLEQLGQILAQVQRIRTTTDAYLPFLAKISDGIDKINSGPMSDARAA